jgi:hypothetical protein
VTRSTTTNPLGSHCDDNILGGYGDTDAFLFARALIARALRSSLSAHGVADAPYDAHSLSAMTSPHNTTAQAVAASADAAGLHATATALLLELQTQLGALGASVTAATERGRRPFRPGPDWATRIGHLAYGVYLLADQTGVDIDLQVRMTADAVLRQAQMAAPETGWPFQSA